MLRLRERQPGLPVLVLSARDSTLARTRRFIIPDAGFVGAVKPFKNMGQIFSTDANARVTHRRAWFSCTSNLIRTSPSGGVHFTAFSSKIRASCLRRSSLPFRVTGGRSPKLESCRVLSIMAPRQALCKMGVQGNFFFLEGEAVVASGDNNGSFTRRPSRSVSCRTSVIISSRTEPARHVFINVEHLQVTLNRSKGCS